MPKVSDINFLFEVGTLRHVQRTWRQFLGADFANVSEHTFRLMWVALLIASKEKEVNGEKLLKMALVHDLPESRTGDVHYVSRLYTTRNEQLAINDMLASTSLKEFVDIWEEYERFDCIEAKIVKDADTLDVELELREQQVHGSPLKKLWGARRRQQVKGHKLYTKTAKTLWDEIENADPHAWHFQARNRHNSGDWKR
ncbi:MAG: HD domain-containing protein [Candidatus Berkelbacteria bacterium]|nr:MAG: HD domain-containing protein [Candidatus Berkelbacteria bacterium]QQG51841.1 MAG: HD domain-containing protein [Candidatus Berkelbacteria bacterium]